MKSLTLFSLTALLMTSPAAKAVSIPNSCFTKAASAVEARFGDAYDKDGIEAYECQRSATGKAIVCDVAANKGDGAAADTYQVVLNQYCDKVFRIELTGEE